LAGCVYWFGIDGTFCSVDAVELDRVFQQFHAVSNGLDELSFGVEWEAVTNDLVRAGPWHSQRDLEQEWAQTNAQAAA